MVKAFPCAKRDWMWCVEVLITQSVYICICRYFGSAEGSKFVEEASVNNVKRTWVNYGFQRDWTDQSQGQVYMHNYICMYVSWRVYIYV